MDYQNCLKLIRSKEEEFTKLMKKSFEIAPKCRETSDKINKKALLLKKDILNLKQQINLN